MAARAPYRTRQQEILLDYLKASGGRHFTVEEVREYFISSHSPIGLATIYRHLEKLVADGLVHKYVIDEKSAACFSYVAGEACPEDRKHFHLKCESCGRLFHLECRELEGIQQHLAAEHGFTLNPFRTVFYGICRECTQRGDAGSRDGEPSGLSCGV